jgi:RHS repeat-associated protein
VSYRYDPFGRRIARILGNITELTLYDGWNPVAEYANTPQSTTISLKRTFVWGLDVSGSLQGAGGVGGLLAIREAAGNGSSKAGQAIFPAYDGNGNIIRLTDSNGATVASYAYDGFGNRINPAASDIDSSGYANENRYGFSTKPRDPLTGLLYYGYRWYDPATGKWASRDPIGDLGHYLTKSVGFDESSILNGGIILANLHSFLGNGSPSLIDPNGEFPWFTAAVGAAVGAVVGGVAAAWTGGDLVAGVVGGAVAGAFVGSGAGIVAAMVAGAGGGAAGNVVEQVIENVNHGQSVGEAVSNIDPVRVGVSGAVGAVSGGIANKGLPVIKHWGSKFWNRWRPKPPAAVPVSPPAIPNLHPCVGSPSSAIASSALQQIQLLGSLAGKSAADIEALLLANGFSKTVGKNGGAIWTKALPDGNTAAVRIDPPKVRVPPESKADEVPHVHKEIVPTSRVTNGNYPNRGVTTLDDNGIPNRDPRDTHIPGGF